MGETTQGRENESSGVPSAANAAHPSRIDCCNSIHLRQFTHRTDVSGDRFRRKIRFGAIP